MRAILIALAFLALGDVAGAAMRCGNALVSKGDHAYEVLARCGEPDHREELTGAYLPGVGVLDTEQRWYYNFGPREFLRVVELRGNRVSAIETAGYGFNEGIHGQCIPGRLHEGMSRLELLARCGEPAYRSSRLELLPHGHGDLRLVRPVEEWVYEFGPQRFIRIITLSEGVIEDIERGSRP